MTIPEAFMDKIEFDPFGGCWLWSACVVREYGQVGVGARKWRAHRFAYEASVGPIPPGYFVRHRCDVKLCCNPAHLAVGTPKDNATDSVERGQMGRGETCGRSKLREVEVVQIIRDLARGIGAEELARRHGVVRRTIQFIADGATWKHVSRDEAAA